MRKSIKTPPQALEFEQSVLGAIMTDKNAMAEVGDMLTPHVFYKEAHQEIFKTIETML